MGPLVDAERLGGAVAGRLWTSVAAVAETGSTNADLAALARTGAPGGAVLVADHQTAGRGRFTRVWTAPPGACLAVSVMLRPPDGHPARWLWLPLLAGLAVVDGVRAAAGVEARLKWPNDVLAGGRKLCGILAERVDSAAGPAVVIGMGINTTLAAADLPVPTATSLVLEGGQVDPDALTAAVLLAFEGRYARWLAGADLREDYVAACDTIGRQVRVDLGETAVEGRAVGVDADGRLLVQTGSGPQAFAAGDVWHLR